MKGGSYKIVASWAAGSKDNVFEAIVSEMLLEILEPDTHYTLEQILRRLGRACDDPEAIFQYASENGWFDTYRGFYSYSSQCWLKHTITTVYGTTVENAINQHGYPTSWDEEPKNDPTDIGVWQPNMEKLQQWKQRQQLVRRSRQHV